MENLTFSSYIEQVKARLTLEEKKLFQWFLTAYENDGYENSGAITVKELTEEEDPDFKFEQATIDSLQQQGYIETCFIGVQRAYRLNKEIRKTMVQKTDIARSWHKSNEDFYCRLLGKEKVSLLDEADANIATEMSNLGL